MSIPGLDDLVAPGAEPPAGTLDRAGLRRRVAAVAAFVAGRGGGTWTLHEPDPLQFAAYLFGVSLGGGDVILLPDVRPGTLAALGPAHDGHLGTPAVTSRHVPASAVGMKAGGRHELPGVRPGEVTVLTSGTTGERKHLSRGLERLLAEAAALQRKWPLHGDLVVASMVSHHHMYGLAFGIVWPLAHGAQLLLASQSPVPDFATLDNDAGHRVRLITSPTYLHRLETSLGLANFRDRRERPVEIDCAFSAGAPLDPDKAAAAARRWGCAINEIYGSSETGAVATRRADLGAPWEALPGARLRVEDERLLIDAPYLARDVERPYVSPDRAEAMGASFRLLGRADRVVKVEGKRVSLQQIEDAVRTIDWVESCTAVLLDGARSRIGVAVVPAGAGCDLLRREGKAATDQRLRRALMRDLEAVMLPRRIRYLTAIPASPEGKIDRERLRAAFADQARRLPSVLGATVAEEEVTLDLALDPDLLAFEGHFPARAIAPGVALLHWVVLLAHEHLGTSLRAVRLPNIKFMHTLAPNDRLRLVLSRSEGGIEYRYLCAGEVTSKGRVLIDE